MTPTTRETADHAELARLAEAATQGEWRVAEDNNPFADGRHVFAKGFDGTDFVVLNLKTDHTFVTATSREQQQRNAMFAAAANPATVKNLLSEIAALRGERTFLMEQKEGAEDAMFDALTRATQAERQRDELRKALEPFAEAAESLDDETRDHDHIWEQPAAMSIDAGHLRAARTILANQGADQ